MILVILIHQDYTTWTDPTDDLACFAGSVDQLGDYLANDCSKLLESLYDLTNKYVDPLWQFTETVGTDLLTTCNLQNKWTWNPVHWWEISTACCWCRQYVWVQGIPIPRVELIQWRHMSMDCDVKLLRANILGYKQLSHAYGHGSQHTLPHNFVFQKEFPENPKVPESSQEGLPEDDISESSQSTINSMKRFGWKYCLHVRP